jgi:hypothetical protein
MASSSSSSSDSTSLERGVEIDGLTTAGGEVDFLFSSSSSLRPSPQKSQQQRMKPIASPPPT